MSDTLEREVLRKELVAALRREDDAIQRSAALEAEVARLRDALVMLVERVGDNPTMQFTLRQCRAALADAKESGDEQG